MKIFAAKNNRLSSKRLPLNELQRFGLILGGSAVILLALAVRIHNSNNCGYQYPFKHPINVVVNNKTIKTEAVLSKHDLEQGLAGVPCLPDGQGMLFEFFNAPGDYSFWMKGMKFPLDIIWLDQDGFVLHVERNVKPESYPKTYKSGHYTSYVLEMAAGQASHYHLADSKKLQIENRIGL